MANYEYIVNKTQLTTSVFLNRKDLGSRVPYNLVIDSCIKINRSRHGHRHTRPNGTKDQTQTIPYDRLSHEHKQPPEKILNTQKAKPCT